MIEWWILNALTFVIGYIIGSHTVGSTLVDIDTQRLKAIAKKINPIHPHAGLVSRPSAQTLYDRENPKLAEEKAAVKEALDRVIPPTAIS